MIYVKVFGGKSVKKVLERTFATAKDARQYLLEMGVPPETRSRGFSIGYKDFTLSHPCEDIMAHDDLPDNAMSSSMSSFLNGRRTEPVMPTTKSSPPTEGRPTEASTKPSTGGKLVCLKEICRQLDIDPRAARSKLRRANPQNNKQRWEWPESEVDSIKAILKK